MMMMMTFMLLLYTNHLCISLSCYFSSTFILYSFYFVFFHCNFFGYFQSVDIHCCTGYTLCLFLFSLNFMRQCSFSSFLLIVHFSSIHIFHINEFTEKARNLFYYCTKHSLITWKPVTHWKCKAFLPYAKIKVLKNLHSCIDSVNTQRDYI